MIKNGLITLLILMISFSSYESFNYLTFNTNDDLNISQNVDLDKVRIKTKLSFIS